MGIFFIGGSMRTGTNLLQRILCGAPTTHDRLEEAGFLTGLMDNFVTQLSRHPQRTLQYFESLDAATAYQQRILADFFAEVSRRHPNARDLVLKKPELTRTFPELAQLVPEARFIVMMRDPRDTIASMISVGEKQKALGKNSLLASIGRDIPKLCGHFASFYNRLWPAMKDKAIAQRTFVLRYEDLVASPEVVVTDLARFTGLTLSPETLAEQGVKADGGPTPFRTELTGGAISDRKVARYMAELSPDEQLKISHLLLDIIQAFQYPIAEGLSSRAAEERALIL